MIWSIFEFLVGNLSCMYCTGSDKVEILVPWINIHVALLGYQVWCRTTSSLELIK